MFTFAEIVLSNRTMLREAAPDMMVNFPIEIPGAASKKPPTVSDLGRE